MVLLLETSRPHRPNPTDMDKNQPQTTANTHATCPWLAMQWERSRGWSIH